MFRLRMLGAIIAVAALVACSAPGTPPPDKTAATGASTAAGVVHSVLYGPMAPVGKTCDTITDQMWHDAITSGKVAGGNAADLAVSGDGMYVVSVNGMHGEGCYRWFDEVYPANWMATSGITGGLIRPVPVPPHTVMP